MHQQVAVEEATSQIKPTGYTSYRLYLLHLYQAIKKRVSGAYSYKSFAEQLGFKGTTVMHQIVKGYRPLTVKSAERIVKAIGLTHGDRKYFLHLVQYNNAKRVADKEKHFEALLRIRGQQLPESQDKDFLDYFSAWYHPVIRELVGLSEFQDDPLWIADKVFPKIRPEQAKKSMELLQRLKLIERLPDGSWRQAEERVSTGHRVRGLALSAFHQAMIELASRSIASVPGKERDISSLTIKTSEKDFHKIKTRIHEFQLELLEMTENKTDGERVYQLNLQLFPVSK